MDSSQFPLPQSPSLSELESQMQLMQVSQEIHRPELFYQRYPLFLSFFHNLHQLKHTSHPHQPQENPNYNLKNTLSFETNLLQNIDELLTQLVTANMEKDLVQHQLHTKEQKLQEASKTIELLKNVVILLDMENTVALEEAETMGYKLTSLLEQNKELANESLFMKNEAVELARCVLNMRDEHFDKVCILQNRIYALQASRNLQQSDEEAVYEKVFPGCFGLDNKHKSKKRKKSETRSKPEEKRRSKWLKKLDNINPFTKCSLIPSATPSCSTLNLLD